MTLRRLALGRQALRGVAWLHATSLHVARSRAPWAGVVGLSALLICGLGAYMALSPAEPPAATLAQDAAAGRTVDQREATSARAAQAIVAAAARPVSATPAAAGASSALPAEDGPATGWVADSEAAPAFALGPFLQASTTTDLRGLAAMAGVVETVRHTGGGGRDDALTIGDSDEKGPLLRVSLYRPGSEPQPGGSFFVDVARRAGEAGMWVERFADLPPLETRLGLVQIAMARFGASSGARRCMAFRQNRSQPDLRLSGWVCLPGEAAPAPEAVACLVDAVRWQREQDEPEIARLFAAAAANESASVCAQTGDVLTSAISPGETAHPGGAERR